MLQLYVFRPFMPGYSTLGIAFAIAESLEDAKNLILDPKNDMSAHTDYSDEFNNVTIYPLERIGFMEEGGS